MILRKAFFEELPVIWDILRQAIEQRKQDGSEQWQNGYPNEQTVHDDITNGYAYVLVDNNVIIGSATLLPAIISLALKRVNIVKYFRSASFPPMFASI